MENRHLIFIPQKLQLKVAKNEKKEVKGWCNIEIELYYNKFIII